MIISEYSPVKFADFTVRYSLAPAKIAIRAATHGLPPPTDGGATTVLQKWVLLIRIPSRSSALWKQRPRAGIVLQWTAAVAAPIPLNCSPTVQRRGGWNVMSTPA